ncbi:MAG TPA: pseudouridine synthase [Candidatus Saccharimonadales bacterium]
MTPDSKRLNKYLALQLGISRREADDLIENGGVLVNGVAAELGKRIIPTDNIEINGQPLKAQAKLLYIAFHKPVGYVCSRKAQGDNPTIYDILPSEFYPLKPVGRLDKDSSGLILLTNDGDFAHSMTHPSFRKIKVYEVILDQDLEPLHQQMVHDFGIQLEDGISKLQLVRLSETSRRNWQVTMHEGRNRQIRRTFTALGYTVTALHRTQFGPYQLGALAAGKWQEIQPL